MMRNKSKVLAIIFAIISIIVVATLGSLFVNLGTSWFNLLIKPSQWIPNIIIPIVWTIIYITFAIILTIWIIKEYIPLDVVILLIINGILNIVWCLVFFALHLTFIGNLAIVLNLIMAVVLFVRIFRVKPVYALVTSIYPIWLSFATTLNLALWILN